MRIKSRFSGQIRGQPHTANLSRTFYQHRCKRTMKRLLIQGAIENDTAKPAESTAGQQARPAESDAE
jgi:hypothetical protein